MLFSESLDQKSAQTWLVPVCILPAENTTKRLDPMSAAFLWKNKLPKMLYWVICMNQGLKMVFGRFRSKAPEKLDCLQKRGCPLKSIGLFSDSIIFGYKINMHTWIGNNQYKRLLQFQSSRKMQILVFLVATCFSFSGRDFNFRDFLKTVSNLMIHFFLSCSKVPSSYRGLDSLLSSQGTLFNRNYDKITKFQIIQSEICSHESD